MSYIIALTDVADSEVRMRIAAPLIEYNSLKGGPDNHRALVVTVADETGAVVGGLWGYTNYGWLFVQLLVVPEALRGQGIGTKLMVAAEREAVVRGCPDAWLDTHEFQARGFYEKLGYETFGELPNYPPGFSRIFLKKHLAPT